MPRCEAFGSDAIPASSHASTSASGKDGRGGSYGTGNAALSDGQRAIATEKDDVVALAPATALLCKWRHLSNTGTRSDEGTSAQAKCTPTAAKSTAAPQSHRNVPTRSDRNSAQHVFERSTAAAALPRPATQLLAKKGATSESRAPNDLAESLSDDDDWMRADESDVVEGMRESTVDVGQWMRGSSSDLLRTVQSSAATDTSSNDSEADNASDDDSSRTTVPCSAPTSATSSLSSDDDEDMESCESIYERLFEVEQPCRAYTVAEHMPLPTMPGTSREISGEAVDFVRACLCLNPTERRTVFELVRHPWIRGGVGGQHPRGSPTMFAVSE